MAPERLARWLSRFSATHGPVRWTAGEQRVVVVAADGARAECEVPFPPLPPRPDLPFGGLVEHAAVDRTVGILLVRLGGHAAGVFTGSRLTSSAVGRRPVHGRAAAGGWSQHRFARRREGQARAALDAAAAAAERVLVPALPGLAAVVAGGDRRAVEAVLGDERLARLRPLLTGPLLDVPDPRRSVLEGAGELCRRVRIRVLDAPAGAGAAPPVSAPQSPSGPSPPAPA